MMGIAQKDTARFRAGLHHHDHIGIDFRHHRHRGFGLNRLDMFQPGHVPSHAGLMTHVGMNPGREYLHQHQGQAKKD